jgi:putative peptidoglycan lipid II flippase
LAGVVKSSINLSLITLLISCVSFFNQLIIAKIFGASVMMDVYLIGGSIPLHLSSILSAALGFTLVPVLIKNRLEHTKFNQLVSSIGIFLFLFLLAITLCGVIFSPNQIEILGKTLTVENKILAVSVSRLSWVVAALTITTSFLSSIHNAANRFLLPVLISVTPFFGMILFALVYASEYGPIAIVVGMLSGYLFTVLALSIYPLKMFSCPPLVSKIWIETFRFYLRIPLAIIAMFTFSIFLMSDAYWAPRIAVGSLSYLAYSQKIIVTFGSLLIAGPGVVILSNLSSAYAEGRTGDLIKNTKRAIGLIFLFAVPFAVVVSILAKPIIGLLLERGAFNGQATEGVSEVLPVMLFGMIPMLSVSIIFRALYAVHNIIIPAIIGIIVSGTYFFFSGIFSADLGVMGIAFAYALTWWATLIFLGGLLIWGRGYLNLKEFIKYLYQLGIILIPLYFISMAGNFWIISGSSNSKWVIFSKLILIFITETFSYFYVSVRLLKINDVQLFYEYIHRGFVVLVFKKCKS